MSRDRLPRINADDTDSKPPAVIEDRAGAWLLRLTSADGMNRLTRASLSILARWVEELAAERSPRPLIVTGNQKFFSAGADLNEISRLSGAGAFDFARNGQRLMQLVADFPAPVIAAVQGHCFGGGLDLALACHRRLAAPNAVFGHRGASLGLITGWGGTQRLPRRIGKGRALQMFCAAEKLTAKEALECGLVERVVDDPVEAAVTSTQHSVPGTE
ncbi:MAG TPA: enoyl-CoA hydratase/isomerase family protein [Terriglobales bacterium]|nr:enoyl-CoA hydratase/isomerase family protein [Terriglobales bacterium]